ncbi:MAG TPA: hypothetical protein VGG34_10530 [Opitutaceae bacterium]|jgi:sugar lactone lactonase YvrE
MTSIHRGAIAWPAILLATSAGFGAVAIPPKLPVSDVIVGQLTYSQTYTFTNLAGEGGTKGKADGTGTAASFYGPNGVAVDSAGTIYVSDVTYGLIRKITPAGVVTTLALKFSGQNPIVSLGGLCVDGRGNIFVADVLANVIYKITPDGTFSTFAGSGSAGSADGTGTAATFYQPGALAVDANGTIYLADSANNTIRKITAEGLVSTFAGTAGVRGGADGTGAAAQFSNPGGIAVDGNGFVYVSDTENNTIRKITPQGVVSTLAGTARVTEGAQDGTGPAAQFAAPEGLAIDPSGNVIVSDTASQLVRRVTPAGVVTTCAGQPVTPGNTDGAGAAAEFDDPSGLAIDSSGNIYVANYGAETIRKGVYSPPPAPVTVSISGSIPSYTVPNGSAPITLTTVTTGNPTNYQWYLNGAAIAGSTGYQLVVYPTAANQGDYTVTVSSPTGGSASSDAGSLTVSTDAWIINLSARAYSESGSGGANQLIAGFVTTGPNQKSVLIRGDGPALGAFNISDYLADPQLTLVSGSTTVASTNSWSTSLDAAFAEVGAFALTPGSHDTALIETLSPGPYTAQIISQTSNNGVALAEIYDADDLAPTDRLVNISARAFVGTGANILIGGFVISGSTPQTVIIRGDGPALAGFGLSGALSGATLTLSNNAGATISMNSGWGTAPTVGSAAVNGIVIQPLTAALSAKVGAFTLTAGSADGAIVATLPPGNYTAQVSGTAGTTGVALVEIYELR